MSWVDGVMANLMTRTAFDFTPPRQWIADKLWTGRGRAGSGQSGAGRGGALGVRRWPGRASGGLGPVALASRPPHSRCTGKLARVVHRAVTLALMIAFSIVLLALTLVSGLSAFGWRSLVALAVVVVAAALAGIAFSWRRYFPRR